MRLIYDFGRFCGRTWARAQLRRNPAWLERRHLVETRLQIIADDLVYRHLDLSFWACGMQIHGIASGQFKRRGMKDTSLGSSWDVTAAIVAYDQQLISDHDLDMLRVWGAWCHVCSYGHQFFGFEQLQPGLFLPLRERYARARKLAALYPPMYHHEGLTSFILYYGLAHGSPWPEDRVTQVEQVALDESIAEFLVVSH